MPTLIPGIAQQYLRRTSWLPVTISSGKPGWRLHDFKAPDELVIGPYQGTLGCLRIPFGKGVCGTAAQTRQTQLVPDVHAFPGHIACDSRSNSEIVVPVFDASGALVAVLDVDSTRFNAFDAVDQAGLESICGDLLALP